MHTVTSCAKTASEELHIKVTEGQMNQKSCNAGRQMEEQRALIRDSHLALRHAHADGKLMNEIHLKCDVELM